MAVFISKILLVAFISSLIAGTQSANILGVFTSLSPSHLIIHMSVAQVLADNGHNVTVVTAMKPPLKHKNINLINLSMNETEEKLMNKIIADMASRDNSHFLITMYRMIGQMTFMLEKMFNVMQDAQVVDLYENKGNKFDLVIIGFFMNNYQLGIAHKLKAPVIITAPMPPNEMFHYMLGNPSEISSVPLMSIVVEKGQPMSFIQRLMNFVTYAAFHVFLCLLENKNLQYYQKLYGSDPNMPSYADLYKNVSLAFFNSHATSEGPIRANVPAIVEVGGIQIKEQPAALPNDIAEFLGNSSQGAILLSLGSNIKGAHIKPDTIKKMFNVLSKLKQRIIWKWENQEQTPGTSENILYSKWLPQDDILAHPNIELFITHAGKGGISEAQYHGKPMLALPVFGDQPDNAENMVKKGFGLSLNLLQLEEKTFEESILQILEKPEFASNVKQFSTLYKDRPLTARQSVLYWSEYVLRHHGAPHMQSPAAHMSFVAVNNLDVYGVVLAILITLFMICKVLISYVYRKVQSKRGINKKNYTKVTQKKKIKTKSQ